MKSATKKLAPNPRSRFHAPHPRHPFSLWDGYAELENIYRQKQQWMRDASLDFAWGNVAEAVTRYTDQVGVLGSALKAEAVTSLIDDWNRDYDPAKSTLILAHLRQDVRALNDLARGKLIERRLIEPGHAFRTEDGERLFAADDQIVFLKNEGSLGVKNGMIARVIEASRGRIVADIGDGPSDSRRRVAVYGCLRLSTAVAIDKRMVIGKVPRLRGNIHAAWLRER